MTDGIQFKIEGRESLFAKFDAIAYDLKRKGGRSALRKAAMVVVKAAKQNAEAIDDPDTGRSIADNVALRWDGKLFKRTGDLGFRIGILHGAVLKRGGDLSKNAPTPHWRLIEFGTEKMPANPFFRKALADNIAKVTDTFLTEYEKAIDRAIKRAAKKAGK